MDLSKKKINSSPGSRMTSQEVNAMLDVYKSASIKAQQAAQQQQQQHQHQHQHQQEPRYQHQKHVIQQRYQIDSTKSMPSISSGSGAFKSPLLNIQPNATYVRPTASSSSPLNLKYNTNDTPASFSSASVIAEGNAIPSKKISMPSKDTYKSRFGKTGPYKCSEDAWNRPVNAVRQLPTDPKLKVTIDDSSCLKLLTSNAMTEKDRMKILENSVVRRAKPTSVLFNEKAYPSEFKASGPQVYSMDLVAAGKDSFMSIYTNRPDPVRYPDNKVQYVHSVYKDQEKIYEKQSRFYHKGDALSCASVFCIERVSIEEAKRVEAERKKEADALENKAKSPPPRVLNTPNSQTFRNPYAVDSSSNSSTSSSGSHCSTRNPNAPGTAYCPSSTSSLSFPSSTKSYVFKPNVSTKK